ncbi:nuclear transport factor 2 family protein [Pseudomonas sp. SST3]|uniref:nuclear transport factor 2 family protein n=1 Tax=Pseudomonas sp. SST3 TaxID=2267882 RepID=UPI000DFAD907|nr:nuclear transport factor 2 family protein [Pseudomonas sp. SST3]NKQ11641.1 nuclear transport factor 2 family protein [Pseudomonas sp. SST3]
MNVSLSLQPAAASTLQRWHRMIESEDLNQLPELLHPQAVFRSPMAFKPYEGAAAVNLILNTVVTVFEDFAYHRELASADGSNVVLEFSARVGDRQLKGIDLICFDEAGLITDFEVMVRPMSGLQALGEEMGKRLAPQLAALKPS